MNILFYELNVLPESGGVERVSANLAVVFKKHGITSYVAHRSAMPPGGVCPCYEKNFHVSDLTSDTEQRFLDFLSENDITVIINQCADNLRALHFLKRIKDRKKLHLISCLHRSPLDYKNSFLYKSIRFPRLYLRAWGKHLIHFFYKVDKRRLTEAYRISEKVILLSEKFIPEFKAVMGANIDPSRLAVITNMRTYPETLPEEEIGRKEKIVLYVGRVNEITKRCSLILDVWQKLCKRFPDWRLYMVGDGPQKEQYEKMAQKEGIENIFFVGQTDPYPFYRKASVFFLTSVSESFSMVLVEAAENGMVPIAFDSYASITDVINHPESGRIIPNNDLDCFAQTAELFMGDQALREATAKNAILWTERFSEEEIWSCWKTLLDEICEK